MIIILKKRLRLIIINSIFTVNKDIVPGHSVRNEEAPKPEEFDDCIDRVSSAIFVAYI